TERPCFALPSMIARRCLFGGQRPLPSNGQSVVGHRNTERVCRDPRQLCPDVEMVTVLGHIDEGKSPSSRFLAARTAEVREQPAHLLPQPLSLLRRAFPPCKRALPAVPSGPHKRDSRSHNPLLLLV